MAVIIENAGGGGASGPVAAQVIEQQRTIPAREETAMRLRGRLSVGHALQPLCGFGGGRRRYGRRLRARDTLLGRMVALKVLRSQYASDLEFVGVSDAK